MHNFDAVFRRLDLTVAEIRRYNFSVLYRRFVCSVFVKMNESKEGDPHTNILFVQAVEKYRCLYSLISGCQNSREKM
jgi:hypothetical protein